MGNSGGSPDTASNAISEGAEEVEPRIGLRPSGSRHIGHRAASAGRFAPVGCLDRKTGSGCQRLFVTPSRCSRRFALLCVALVRPQRSRALTGCKLHERRGLGKSGGATGLVSGWLPRSRPSGPESPATLGVPPSERVQRGAEACGPLSARGVAQQGTEPDRPQLV